MQNNVDYFISESNAEADNADTQSKAIDLWRVFTDKSLSTFALALKEGLSSTPALRVRLNENGSTELHLGDKSDGVEFQYESRHPADEISSIYSRNAGEGTQLLQNFFTLKPVERKIRVQARYKDGPYFWARSGWVPDKEGAGSWDDLRPVLKARMQIIEAQVQVPREVQENLEQACSSSSPKALWRIVDEDFPVNGMKLGKALVTNVFGRTMDSLGLDCAVLGDEQEMLAMSAVSWDGEFDPADSGCVARLQKKLGMRNVVVSRASFSPETNKANKDPKSNMIPPPFCLRS